MDKPKLKSGPTGPYAHGYKMCMVEYADGTMKGITWHRYIYESEHGRLPSDIHVHHKNCDRSDNRLGNLEAKTNVEHCRDHQQRPTPMKEYLCPWCGKNFKRMDRAVKHNQGHQKKAGPFCGKSCGASWGREKQLGRL